MSFFLAGKTEKSTRAAVTIASFPFAREEFAITAVPIFGIHSTFSFGRVVNELSFIEWNTWNLPRKTNIGGCALSNGVFLKSKIRNRVE